MKRHLLNFAAVVSLLLCLGVAVAWWHSGPYDERVQVEYARWTSGDELYAYEGSLASYAGTLSLHFYREYLGAADIRALPAEHQQRLRELYYPRRTRWLFVPQHREMFLEVPPEPGFRFRHQVYQPGGTRRGDDFVFAVPAWLAMAVLLVLPAVRLRQVRAERRRRRVGLCPTCGYDLRATPDRCPECGAIGPTPSATTNARPTP